MEITVIINRKINIPVSVGIVALISNKTTSRHTERQKGVTDIHYTNITYANKLSEINI